MCGVMPLPSYYPSRCVSHFPGGRLGWRLEVHVRWIAFRAVLHRLIPQRSKYSSLDFHNTVSRVPFE